jgi:hypothetical protein
VSASTSAPGTGTVILVDGEQADSVNFTGDPSPADIGAIPASEKGTPGGVATLAPDGTVEQPGTGGGGAVAISAPGFLGSGAQIATSRNGFYFSGSNGETAGTSTWRRTRTRHVARAALGGVKIVAANHINDNELEFGPLPTVTYRFWVEWKGELVPAYFDDGSLSKALPAGGYGIALAPVPFANGENVYVWTEAVVANLGEKMPSTHGLDSSAGEGTAAGTGVPPDPSIASPPSGGGVGTGPFVVCGINTVPALLPQILVLGDSVDERTADTNQQPGVGYIQRALHAAGLPYVTMARGGSTLYGFLTAADSRHRRAAIVGSGFTAAFVGFQRNDHRDGRTDVQIKADYLTLGNWLAEIGIPRIVMATTPPYDTAHPNATREGYRKNVNAWKLTVPGPYTYCLDSGAPVTDTDGTSWKAGMSNDTIHPTTAGHAAMQPSPADVAAAFLD